MRSLLVLLVLAVTGCGEVVTRQRLLAVRIYEAGAPIAWRYRTLGAAVGYSCGNLLLAGSESDARQDLRARVVELGGHGVTSVVCQRGAEICGPNTVRCEGDAIRWERGQ